MVAVAPDDAWIVTCAAEALWIVFVLAADPGGNVLVPQAGFPTFTQDSRGKRLDPRRRPVLYSPSAERPE